MNLATIVLAVLCVLPWLTAGSAEKRGPDSKFAPQEEVAAVESGNTKKVQAPRRPEFRTARSEIESSPYQSAGVMTTFLDFDGADNGEQLGYLLWGELAALLRSPREGDSVKMLSLQSVAGSKYGLGEDYHVSASAIATDFGAPLTFWGAVKAKDDGLLYNAFLTLDPELARTDLVLSVALEADPSTRYEAGLTRTRYEFTGNTRSRGALFDRNLIVRVETALLVEPSSASARLATLAQNQALTGLEVTGPWYRVRTAAGQEGYVDIAQLQVLPRAVDVSAKGATPRRGPAEHFAAARSALESGEYPLLGLEHDADGRVWYRVSFGNADGWIDGESATPVLTLPVMDFLAGLYFYRASEATYKCHYRRAAAHFSRFVVTAANTAKNTNLASAHQLYANAMLLSDETCGRDDEKALKAYSAAIDLTPYDPTAYNLQAVASIGQDQLSATALESLAASLELDAFEPVAAALVLGLHGAVHSGAVRPASGIADRLDALRRTVNREHVVRSMARIKQEPHLRLDTRGRTLPPITEPQALLTFLNRSQSDLVVYLAASDKRDDSSAYHQIALPNGVETELRISPGTYDIAVEAPNSQAKSIYGRHTYASSSHHELDFFVRLSDVPIAGP